MQILKILHEFNIMISMLSRQSAVESVDLYSHHGGSVQKNCVIPKLLKKYIIGFLNLSSQLG